MKYSNTVKGMMNRFHRNMTLAMKSGTQEGLKVWEDVQVRYKRLIAQCKSFGLRTRAGVTVLAEETSSPAR